MRVHEPLSVLDLLEVGASTHSWTLDAAMEEIAKRERGVIVLLNCGDSKEHLIDVFEAFDSTEKADALKRRPVDFKTYGIGAQILRELGVGKMQLLSNPRKLGSMSGYGLEVTGFVPMPGSTAQAPARLIRPFTRLAPTQNTTEFTWKSDNTNRISTATDCASASCRRASTNPSATVSRTPASKNCERLGVTGEDVLLVTVPGALEIPLALQKLAESAQFDALIALGAVIRGETYHFELVSNESGAGITRIALDFGMPIANAVLTTENDEQAVARMTEKGRDAARVAVEMANLAVALEQLGGDDEEDEEEEEA